MTRIYFDITDIIYYASRYSRLTGIQRVQLCITGLLARRHGGDVIRCMFFDQSKQTMLEFDPAMWSGESEFDAERLLVELGLVRPSAIFPSRVQVKSYLRQYNHSKPLRTFKKMDVYLSALLLPKRLRSLGLAPGGVTSATPDRISTTEIGALQKDSCYACLGSVWLHPEVMEFASRHHAGGGAVVQMIYDLIPISHPGNYSARESAAYVKWLTSAFDYTSRFISISQWTATALREFAGRYGRTVNVEVVPLAHEFMGCERNARYAVPSGLTYLAQSPYVLCVGTIEHRKNGIALLKVWQKLIVAMGGNTPRLVFAGKYGKGGAEFQEYLRQHPELASCVHVVHAPSDHDLAWLYGNCLMTVFPSLIEGWGLPVGESVWFGKFCIASRATSIPEVCGDLVDYVAPDSVEDMCAGVCKPIMDPEYLAYRENQLANAMLRRWEDVAEDVYRVVSFERRRQSLS